MRFRPKWQKITYTTHTYPSKLVPSTYLRRKIGIQVHNITPRPLSRTRLSPTNLPKSVLERCVITDLKHTVAGSAKVLLLSKSPFGKLSLRILFTRGTLASPSTRPTYVVRHRVEGGMRVRTWDRVCRRYGVSTCDTSI